MDSVAASEAVDPGSTPGSRTIYIRTALFLSAATIACLSPDRLAAALDADTDPYLWLEDAHGARAMAWVQAENDKTLPVLEKDPHYADFYAEALAIAEDEDRIPEPNLIDGSVLNFWQGVGHVRGYLRRTTLESYRTASPDWVTVLDLDQLAQAENANWFFKGIVPSEPREHRCLVSLSDGGEDAVTVREFDLPSAKFVDGGFVLPHAKQRFAWEDDDTLLVSRAWAPDELTKSGYPFIVKRLGRGDALADAKEIFRGSAADGGYGVAPFTLYDGSGNRLVLINRPLTTFESEKYIVNGDQVRRLMLPKKARIWDMVDGKLIVSLEEDWSPGDLAFKSGSLLSLDVAALTADPAHLKPVAIYVPGPREALDAARATKDRLVVTTYDNVRGRVFVYRPDKGGRWTQRKLDLPDNATVGIADTELHSDLAFVDVTGFLQPNSLWLVDASNGGLSEVKALPAKFDASHLVTEQMEATSKDGTHVPYFVVHPAGMKMDGSNPTILYGYGGFQISETPRYSGTIGKLWLERGGVYVLANIRGGGEFGPAWHEAGLKTQRQRIYDDFAAVAEDLMERDITSPRRLGIQGGSNGGLLMGVEFNQHPDLWNAVDIQVPLLDMVRFEKIDAGSSWIGEYGSMSNPGEAAFLAKISPYANVRRGVNYPQAFIWTTTKDDRVGPQHARKFAARLSEFGIPYYFYEVTEGGHGSGANLRERAHTTALEMTYFARKLMD
jgi:prolyl oligopeptidase